MAGDCAAPRPAVSAWRAAATVVKRKKKKKKTCTLEWVRRWGDGYKTHRYFFFFRGRIVSFFEMFFGGLFLLFFLAAVSAVAAGDARWARDRGDLLGTGSAYNFTRHPLAAHAPVTVPTDLPLSRQQFYQMMAISESGVLLTMDMRRLVGIALGRAGGAGGAQGTCREAYMRIADPDLPRVTFAAGCTPGDGGIGDGDVLAAEEGGPGDTLFAPDSSVRGGAVYGFTGVGTLPYEVLWVMGDAEYTSSFGSIGYDPVNDVAIVTGTLPGSFGPWVAAVRAADGRFAWRFYDFPAMPACVANSVYSTPVVAESGTVIFRASCGVGTRLLGVAGDPQTGNASLVLDVALGVDDYGAPLILTGSKSVVVDNGPTIRCIDIAHGAGVNWTSPVIEGSGRVFSMVESGGTIFAARLSTTHVVALDASNGSVLWINTALLSTRPGVSLSIDVMARQVRVGRRVLCASFFFFFVRVGWFVFF
jgi:hypothetical protein